MPPPINPIALTGFANASAYDAHRPSYPSSLVAHLLQHLDITNELHAHVLELAAGTGKFTELLAAREEEYEILAVEPHAGMRGVLEGKGLRGVKVLEGSAERMKGVGDGWAEAVVVAQGFHWFATMEALKEIHRVMKPGAVLGLIWNIEDYVSRTDWTTSTVWEGKLKEIIWAFDDTSARFRHNRWQKVFDEQTGTNPLAVQASDPLFSLPLGEESEKWTTWLSKDAIWKRFHTMSQIANLKGEQLEAIKKKTYEAMDGEDVETNENGELAVHGVTVCYWTTAIPAAPLKSGG